MEIYIAAYVALQAKRELGLTRALSLPADTVMAKHKPTAEWRKATVISMPSYDDGSYTVSNAISMLSPLQYD
jgi:hypothetical protein